MKRTLWSSLFFLCATLSAQTAIPPGTVLPLQLNSSVNSRKAVAGLVVTARGRHDGPLPSGARMRGGSKVSGRVLDAVESSSGSGAKLTLQFDILAASKEKTSITTDLRALASMMEVEAAQVPESGPDRGTSQSAWTTQQIGGETVYRGGGPVANSFGPVGEPVANGVLVHIAANRNTECDGGANASDRLQALWVFSSDACGVYGFPDLTIAHAGRSAPLGQIILQSGKGDFVIRSGSGLLLRTQ